ncbi:hypothetical protein [Thalassobacillus sp. CUG 92003]|uniref:hypothetical protein n=1 Tax=Thalassobacillus sp. CUG 92003 TaxID=2736641 RepID=UPI0015E6747C|nr:hypothetical protein [Thalassobacillus sp. CUG 92003]
MSEFLTITVLIAVFYVLPAYINWRQVRWMHTHIFKNITPTSIDILFTVIPGVNVVIMVLNAFAILAEKIRPRKRGFPEKFFKL